MTNFPEDFELLNFFEVEPSLLDNDVPWHYNILTFNKKQGHEKITIHISPAYGDFEIFWEQDNELIFHWKLFNIQEVKIEKKDDKEYMRIIIEDDRLDDCIFFIKPRFKLLGGMKISNE